jgi:Ca2+-binding EF-hand superfamily protein
MTAKGYTTKLLFTSWDANQDGMLTLNEFKKGLSLLITISSTILDKLFVKIDRYQIGMIDFQQFQEVLEAKAPT